LPTSISSAPSSTTTARPAETSTPIAANEPVSIHMVNTCSSTTNSIACSTIA
jgi:hypothetical protein